MSNYKGHVIGGCFAYGLLLAALVSFCSSWHVAAEWFAFCFAGSLFPDIDTKSRGQKYFYRVILIVFAVLIAQQRLDLLAVFSLCAVVPLLTNHRGIFHHFWFVIGMPIVVWCIAGKFWPQHSGPLFFDTLFFIAGAISHLMLDFYFVPIMRSLGLLKKQNSGWARR